MRYTRVALGVPISRDVRIIVGSKAVHPERLEGLDVDTYLGVSTTSKKRSSHVFEADALWEVQTFEYYWTNHEQGSATSQTYRGPVARKHRMGFRNCLTSALKPEGDPLVIATRMKLANYTSSMTVVLDESNS